MSENNYDSMETDTNTDYESDSDSDIDYEENFIYEENLTAKHYIILCELYNPYLHGKPISKEILYHYLVDTKFKRLNMNIINEMSQDISYRLNNLSRPHPLFKNYYMNISSISNPVKPEIAVCIYLESGYCVAIIKTIWIKLIQRTWKKIIKERKNITQKRCLPRALHYRNIHGNWPKECFYYPTLRGMLSKLYKKG
jgi:hypothetical protein